MKLKYFLIVLAVFLISSPLRANKIEELAANAISADSSTAAPAIRELRLLGPAGLDALFAKYSAEIQSFKMAGEADENWKRIANAIDTVAMQKDAYSSRLFWHTDLAAAKLVAAKQNKPILTLRLLGNLNEEFSCANSRLFRSILYSNAEISRYLRDNYVLHWQSVRPAPRITIDFGDGRKIERTITGNSIHYVIDPDGTIIDGIPGLYSPTAFLSNIKSSNTAFKAASKLNGKQKTSVFLEYRKQHFDRIKQERSGAIEKAGVELTETRTGTLAILAAPMAAAKMVVVDEYSILRVYDDFAKFEPSIDFGGWEKLSKAYSPTLGIDQNTVAMIRRQNAKTGLGKAEFDQLFAKLDSFIALDTTRNDFLFHTKIYEWLNQQRGIGDLEAFNARVYDRLFQTPNSDKWLGLYSTDVYTALDGNGIIK